MLLKALKCIYGVQPLSVFLIMCVNQQTVGSRKSNRVFCSYFIMIHLKKAATLSDSLSAFKLNKRTVHTISRYQIKRLREKSHYCLFHEMIHHKIDICLKMVQICSKTSQQFSTTETFPLNYSLFEKLHDF